MPLNLVQKWLGHAQLSTTATYADATGDEEHAIAARMWQRQEHVSERTSHGASDLSTTGQVWQCQALGL